MANQHHHPFKTLPQSAFLALGIDEVAYVRPQVDGDRVTWVVHRADGVPVTAKGAYGEAAGMILQNDMVPLAVH